MSSNVVEQYRIQIGNQLRMARVSQGWTYEQVATMAGMKPQTVEKIEAGLFSVPLDVLVKVADVLGCEININEK